MTESQKGEREEALEAARIAVRDKWQQGCSKACRVESVNCTFPCACAAISELVVDAVSPLLSSAKAEGEMRELVRAAANYIRCSKSPSLSPYIRENGHFGTKSPWTELCEASAVLSPKEGA